MLTLRKHRKKSFKDKYLINQLETNKTILEKPLKSEESEEKKLSDIVDTSKEVINPISDQNLDRLKIKELEFSQFKENGDSKIIIDIAKGEKTSEKSVDLNVIPPKCEHNHIDQNTLIDKHNTGIYPSYKQNLINKNDIHRVYKDKLIDGHQTKIKRNKKVKRSIVDFY